MLVCFKSDVLSVVVKTAHFEVAFHQHQTKMKIISWQRYNADIFYRRVENIAYKSLSFLVSRFMRCIRPPLLPPPL